MLTAQYWGKGDRDAIEKILGMAVKAAVCVTALFTVSALAVPELLMRYLQTIRLLFRKELNT